MSTGFNKHDIARDACQLFGAQAHQGYDWWWHSFTGHDAETGEAKPFFIEFFLCNPALGGDEPVFGQLPGKPQKPSYLMVKAGAWGADAAQLHRFWGWNRIRVDWNVPFSVEADDCFLTEDRTHGHVKVEGTALHPEWMCADGEMSWNLQIRKITAFNVGFGADELFRHAEAFEMFWHAEGMKTEFEGEVVWNGRKYLVRPEDCYGYADKNWGRDFTSPWVWLSSNNLTSEITGKRLMDSVFDIGGGRPKIGPLALPRKLLSAFWYEGTPYEFNFSKAWTRVRTEFDCRETDTQIVWHVEQRSTSGRMVTDITCEKKDMLLVNYESPDGARRHNRLWNGGNGVGTIQLFDHDGVLVDRIHAENIGCEYGEYCAPEDSLSIVDADTLRPLLLGRENDSHKGDYGHLLIVAGCQRMPGAAVLATGAALQSGCGLVTLHSTERALQAVARSFPSAMLSEESSAWFSQVPARLDRFAAIAVGPGLGQAPETADALAQLLSAARETGVPMVLDADALNLLAGHPEWISLIPEGSILTPHLGELRRLVTWETEAEMDTAVRELCDRTGCVIVVKGYHSRVYSPGGGCVVNTSGNPGMAKGGSGDVLTGLVGGLLARGYAARDAARLGVWIHGHAGDVLTEERTAEAWSSRDLVDRLYTGFTELYGN